MKTKTNSKNLETIIEMLNQGYKQGEIAKKIKLSRTRTSDIINRYTCKTYRLNELGKQVR